MLLSLVLSYYKCKKCPTGMYSEGFILGVKRKLKNARAYTRKGAILFFGFYGILWFYNFRGRGFIFGIYWYIMILQFHLGTTHFNNNQYCYILSNKFILSLVVEGIK